MRRRINNLLTALVVALCLTLAACHSSGDRDVARVRVGEFLATTDSAQVVLSGEGTSVTYQLSYGALSQYREVSAGTYRASVTSGGRSLLDQSVGLGAGGSFTLLLAGLPMSGQQTNQEALNSTMHRIVEGSAAVTTNAYLPQLLIQNDYFVPVAGEGNLRVTHLAPGVVPLDIDIRRDGTSFQLLSDLAYPHTSPRGRYPAGKYRGDIHYSGSPRIQQTFAIELDEYALYDFYLIPDPSHLPGLQVIVGEAQKE